VTLLLSVASPVSISWIDQDGTETPFLGVSAGTVGRGVPPVRPLVTTQPNRAGAVYSGSLHCVRRLSVPFELFSDGDTTGADVRTAVREWALRLATLTAPGKIRCRTEVGDLREIVAWYVGGLELVENIAHYQAATLEFDCPDPYWVDTVDTVSQASGASGITSFFPFFPLSLSASEIAAEITINNTGDLEAWPVISIAGPAVNPTLRNFTTGQVLTLTRTVAAGETVTLDARPGARTVTLQDGTPLYSLLTTRQWWPLARGTNRVRLEASSTTASSLLSVSYRRRFLTV
jgi:hypothetical protein